MRLARENQGTPVHPILMSSANSLETARRVLNGGIVANPLIEDEEEVEVVTEDEEVAEDASMTDRDD